MVRNDLSVSEIQLIRKHHAKRTPPLLAKTALSLNERRALTAFVAALRREHTYDIEDVILYGSAARGGKRVDSDVDVMIVLARPLAEGEQTAICALALELSLAYYCELSPLLMSPESMSWHRQGSSLWLNVLHDGIGLWGTDFDNVLRSRRTLKEKGLLVLTPAQQDEIRIHMEYSVQDLEAARSLLDSRMERQAISRCYYAVFHAASALLLSKGIVRSKHSAVQAAFHQMFVRAGVVPVDVGKTYDALLQERNSADYDLRYLPGEKVAEQRLEQARAFAQRAKEVLTADGYL